MIQVMLLISCILCVICVSISHTEASYDIDSHCPSKGIHAPIEDFPFLVSMHQGSRHICSGTLVTSRWILTAASCVKWIRYRDKLVALAGSAYVLDPFGYITQGQQKRTPISFKIHPAFEEETHKNDVGLVKVHRSFVFNSAVDAIRLPDKFQFGRMSYEGKELSKPGWDFSSSESEDGFYELGKCNVSVRRGEDCKAPGGYRNAMEMKLFLCIYAESGVCFQEDAGAPLLLNKTLIGITTKHANCTKKSPVRHTRIDPYVDWISLSISAAKTQRPQKKIISMLIILSLLYYLIH